VKIFPCVKALQNKQEHTTKNQSTKTTKVLITKKSHNAKNNKMKTIE
jgi:hypothetical protein